MSLCPCVYSLLDVYFAVRSPGPAAYLYVKGSSHECLQEQEEAPWNRKESNVWERGGYLLLFDLLWSERECVFIGCRLIYSRGAHTDHAKGYLGISLQDVSA